MNELDVQCRACGEVPGELLGDGDREVVGLAVELDANRVVVDGVVVEYC